MSEKNIVRLRRIALDGLLRKNPLLLGGLALAPALAPADGRTAAPVGIATLITLLVTNVFASLLGSLIPKKLRPAAVAIVAAGVVLGLEFAAKAIAPDVLPDAALYLALIPLGGLTLARADYSVGRPVGAALIDAAANGVGYAAALVAVAALRELLGFGTAFGLRVLAQPPVPAAGSIVGGFLIVACFAAALQALRLFATRRRTERRRKAAAAATPFDLSDADAEADDFDEDIAPAAQPGTASAPSSAVSDRDAAGGGVSASADDDISPDEEVPV